MKYLNIALITLVLVLSCSASDTTATNEPSSLKVSIKQKGASDAYPNGDGSGVIEVVASATNADRYAFRFDNGDLQESDSGTMEHTFIKEGTNSYTVVVWAYSNTGEFVNSTHTIEVFKSDEVYTTLVFSDEFDYEGNPDEQKWHYQIIPPDNGSWHNGELQHYTDKPENSFVSDGTLKNRGQKGRIHI